MYRPSKKATLSLAIVSFLNASLVAISTVLCKPYFAVFQSFTLAEVPSCANQLGGIVRKAYLLKRELCVPSNGTFASSIALESSEGIDSFARGRAADLSIR
jgi:hypothetical protein